MIHLKNLLSEVNSETPFSLSNRDPWEYYLNSKDKKWYTRKKGSTSWVDMQANLSDENWKIALNRLTTAIKNKTAGLPVKKDSDIDQPESDKLINVLQRMDNGYLISSDSLNLLKKKGQSEFPKHSFWEKDSSTKKLLYDKTFKVRGGIGAYDRTDDDYKNTFRGFKELDIDVQTGKLDYGMFGGGLTQGSNHYWNNVKIGETMPVKIKGFKVFILNWTPGATYSGNKGTGKILPEPIISSYVWATTTRSNGEKLSAWYPTNWISV